MKKEIAPEINELTRALIGAAYAVSNALGHGFLEVVYKNAMMEEMAVLGMSAEMERSFPVWYRGKQVGFYIADIVVENTVILELKAVDALQPPHRAQLLNYLKASSLPIGLLMNFGVPHVEIKRVIL